MRCSLRPRIRSRPSSKRCSPVHGFSTSMVLPPGLAGRLSVSSTGDDPANTYAGQHRPVQTVRDDVLLLCRSDLDETAVHDLTRALFDVLPTLAGHGDYLRLVDVRRAPATPSATSPRRRVVLPRTRTVAMNPEGWLAARSSRLSGWLAGCICCGVILIAWLGLRAADEWRRSSAQLVERRTEEVAGLLATALTRDMRATQVSVLDGRDWDARSLATPYDMNDLVQSAFARYPYPEAFFGRHQGTRTDFFFARSDRTPSWLPDREGDDTFPVKIIRAPSAANALFARIDQDAQARSQYSIFEADIGGHHYQVVARFIYADAAHDRLEGLLGFLVDLDWIRMGYFPPITEQVSRIARSDEGIDCAIVDDKSQPVVGASSADHTHDTLRAFPLFFFDPAIIAGGHTPDLPLRTWKVLVNGDRDPTLAIAARGARRTLLVAGAAAVALGVGLLFTVRASRASAATAAMRSDFVAIVTHALKTPVSVIRGIGETLIRGRVNTPDRLHEYAQLLVQEGHRLTRLIDNMLAYSRVNEAAHVYDFSPHSPADIVEDVMKGFQRLIQEQGFTVDMSIEVDLPDVQADRTSIALALDNLIDNAMRYSGTSRLLGVRATRVARGVEFSVIDRGAGIPIDELGSVQKRFVRGKSAGGHGTGLGLAIAKRIATDHKGQLDVESAIGVGTTVRLIIPVAQ